MRRWIERVVILVVGMALGFGIAGGAGDVEAEDSPSTTSEVTSTTEPTTTTEPVTTTTQAASTTSRVEATTSDFIVELIVLESECFNTAGALVTVEPDLFSDVTGNYTIVYEIHGGEAVETLRLELSDDGSYSYSEHTVSTASCEYDLSTEVVNVIER